jgi:hypothetical protein
MIKYVFLIFALSVLFGLALMHNVEIRTRDLAEALAVCTNTHNTLEENLKDPVFMKACGHFAISQFATVEE